MCMCVCVCVWRGVCVCVAYVMTGSLHGCSDREQQSNSCRRKIYRYVDRKNILVQECCILSGRVFTQPWTTHTLTAAPPRHTASHTLMESFPSRADLLPYPDFAEGEGMGGGDILQTVRTRGFVVCGDSTCVSLLLVVAVDSAGCSVLAVPGHFLRSPGHRV